MLYEVALETADQEMDAWLAAPVAVTPFGATGIVTSGALVAAETCPEAAHYVPLFPL